MKCSDLSQNMWANSARLIPLFAQGESRQETPKHSGENQQAKERQQEATHIRKVEDNANPAHSSEQPGDTQEQTDRKDPFPHERQQEGSKETGPLLFQRCLPPVQ